MKRHTKISLREKYKMHFHKLSMSIIRQNTIARATVALFYVVYGKEFYVNTMIIIILLSF